MTGQINLYDPRLLRRRELLTLTNLVLVSFALLLVVGSLGAWSRAGAAKLAAKADTLGPQVKAMRDQVTALGQEAAARKPDAALASELADLQARLKTRGEVLALLNKGLGPKATRFAEYLRGFARQTPHGVWLTGFAVTSGSSAMEIRGRTTDPSLIPEYIRRLNDEAAFQGKSFSSLHLDIPAKPVGSVAAQQGSSPPPYHEFSLKPVAPGASAAPSAAATGTRS